MRVGFDVTVSTRVTTGVGVYARELQPALEARGIDVRRWEHRIGATGRRWGRVANGARLAAWQSVGCARRAVREHVDVVHATAAVGPLRCERPVVMTIHDATTVTMPLQANPADRLFQRVFAVDAARRADAILAPTHVAAADIIEHYGVAAARVRVVPLGVNEAFRHVTAENARDTCLAFEITRPYVLYVGAEAPRKNLRRLVKAMATERRLDDLDLVIVGPHDPRDTGLDAYGRTFGLPRHVRRLGTVAPGALPALYAGAACVAYVSLCEGFGLPILEAMAAGVPVLTSSCSSMPEVAGNAALLVDPTDVAAIADGLYRVVYDVALADQLRQLGRARSAGFSWARTARLTDEVYRDVTGLAGGTLSPDSAASRDTTARLAG